MDTSQTSSFRGEFGNLPAISEVASGVAEAAGLDEDAVYEVQLAVDEACANIIVYCFRRNWTNASLELVYR